MHDRLILGSGSLMPALVRAIDGSVLVGTPDDSLAETLRESAVAVESIDPTDVTALARTEASVVFVVEDTPQRAIAAAETVRQALPDAHLLAYSGIVDSQTDAKLESVVDTVVNPSEALAGRVLDCVSDPRAPQLWSVLRGIERLAVVTHNNPDPDAIASGIALTRLASAAGCEGELCYYGEISHQENRAFVNVLELELQQLSPDEDLSRFDGIALVDHARPGINDSLPEDTQIDIVIDHHPPRGPIEAEFVDLRSDVGATSTLLVEYFDRLGIPITPTVSTALLFGIHVDTHAFTRGISQQDFEAAAILVRNAEFETLDRIESPSIDHGTLDAIGKAITNRRTEGELLFSCIGQLPNKDTLAQAADRLLRLEGITTTIVSGIYEGQIHISARSRDANIDIGETLRDAFGAIGSAGGHADMAGAQLDLGVLEVVEADESLPAVVELVVAERVLETLAIGAQPPERSDPPEKILSRYTVVEEFQDSKTVRSEAGPADDDGTGDSG